jgi:nitrous oxidase accessory protein
MRNSVFAATFLVLLVFISTALCGFRMAIADTYKFGSSRLSVHNVNTGLDYATIQEAIAANETLDGNTIQVEGGVYYENLVINKSLSLIGGGAENTIIDGGGTGTVVSVEATNVTFSGFAVRDSGRESLDSGIEEEFSYGAIIDDNYVADCRDGILLSALSGYSRVENNNVSSCSGHGIYVFTSFHNTVEGNMLTGNNFSLTIAAGSDNWVARNDLTRNSKGLYLYAATDNVVTKNVANENDEYGMMVSEYSQNNTIYDNDIEGNGYGIYCMDSSNNIFNRNRLDNVNQVSGYSASSNTWFDLVSHEGNFWSDYTGTDADGNGIGDSSYYISYDCYDDYPLVLAKVDRALVTQAKCGVGSTEQVYFHVGPHPNNRTSLPQGWIILGSSLVGANVLINGTERVTNGTGWISFNVTSSEPGKLTWVPRNSYSTVENPSIEWTLPPGSIFLQVLMQWWFVIVGVALGGFVVAVQTRPKRLLASLQPNEVVLRHFRGGRFLSDDEKRSNFWAAATFSSGRWFITNQRLIYEGKIQTPDVKRSIVFPGWTKNTPEVFIFPLDKLKSIEMVDLGRMKGKYVRATFEENGQSREARILTRKKELLLDTLQKASDSAASNSHAQ